MEDASEALLLFYRLLTVVMRFEILARALQLLQLVETVVNLRGGGGN